MRKENSVLLMLRGDAGHGRLLRAPLRQQPEVLEPRVLLSVNPIEFGAVYVEQDLGSDRHADTIEISFTGGALGTELTRVEIDGDKFTPGLSLADMVFDTDPSGLGADLAFAGSVSTVTGDFLTQVIVQDGSSKVTLELNDFTAGDKLLLSIDVDEVQGFLLDQSDLALINEDMDPIASGAEFQGSRLTAFFSAPHFYDAEGEAEFRNRYDSLLQATNLDLPLDDQDNNRDRTAGTVGELSQTWLPISISGHVYEDRDGNIQQDEHDPGIGDVDLALFSLQEDGLYLTTGHTTLTNALGEYSFDVSLGLLPGEYQIREVQPEGYFSIGAEVGHVAGVPAGAIQTSDILTSISIPVGGVDAIEYNFAEARPASIRGRIHLSGPDGDCWDETITHEPVTGTTVLLQNAVGETVGETVTDAEGRYEFTNLRSGQYSLIEITPSHLIGAGAKAGAVDGEFRGVATEPGADTQIRDIELFSGDAGVEYDFCDHPPATLGGAVYHDRDNDGLQDVGEGGIAGAILSLLDETGQIVDSVETNANGQYEFVGLRAGNYRVIELQPDGWLDGKDRAGQIAGQQVGRATNPGDEIAGVSLQWGDDAIDYDFGELKPASIEGRVHLSTPDGDCWDIDEGLIEPVAGAVVQLLDATGQVLVEAITAEDGSYAFGELAPGDYSIRQLTPDGLQDAGAQAGTVDGSPNGNVLDENNIQNISLGSDQAGVNYDFCEYQPATLSGFVFTDSDNDGSREPGELPIAGVLIQLFDEVGNLVAETTTDDNGRYEFEELPPGNYALRQIQPPGYLDGLDSAGTVDGEPRGRAINPGDRLTSIRLGWGETGEEYNFGELLPAAISGSVHSSGEEDCWNDALAKPVTGVTILLLGEDGNTIAETQTDHLGAYSFADLPPGVYSVVQVQPDTLFDGAQRAGTSGGDTSIANRIQSIDLGSGVVAKRYDFCEKPPASISGTVHSSVAEDCWNDPDAIVLSGVTMLLLNDNGEIISQTVTDARGRYVFDELAEGVYSVVQEQPDGLFDGAQRAGTSGGDASIANRIQSIDLTAGSDAVNYDFCEKPPASISGKVHSSTAEDCWNDPDAISLSGVTMLLLNDSGEIISQTVTDAQGRYVFDELAEGVYSVVQEQPDGLFDGAQRAGTSGGDTSIANRIQSIDLTAGSDAVNYDFCEKPPASISGTVHSSTAEDCWNDPDAIPLSDVTLWLLDATGEVVAETTTDALGGYSFDDLPDGQYSVLQQQPETSFDGAQQAGTSGGDVSEANLIQAIDLIAGVNAEDYDFCELPPATISGFVFVDGDPIPLSFGEQLPVDVAPLRDGELTADDTRLPGVHLELRNGLNGRVIDASHALPGYFADGPIQTTTDTQGYYEFAGLPKGNYAVYETHPEAYIDGIDTRGTTPGIAINPVPPGEDDIIIETIKASLSKPPRNDAIVRIQLPPGEHSQLNNFSEVEVVEPTIFPPIEFNPPPLGPIDGIDSPELYQYQRELAPIPLVDSRIVSDGSASDANTWHLSIIDGGQPRVAEVGDGTEYLFPTNLWQQQRMTVGKWTIESKDGETNTRFFGTEEGMPISGDFNGDGATEIGIFAQGEWYIDLNGNGQWDASDLWAKLGRAGDIPVTGDWDGDGKDDIGIFGRSWPGDFRAALTEPGLPDMDNVPSGKQKNLPPQGEDATVGHRVMKLTAKGRLRADVIDHVFLYGRRGDIGVVGDWNGDGIDTVGVFRDGTWRLDVDGNGRWTDPDERSIFGQAGDVPLVGDFNGDGIDDVAIIRNGQIIIDANRNREIDADDLVVEYDISKGLPVAGKWTGDAADSIGFFKPLESKNVVIATRDVSAGS